MQTLDTIHDYLRSHADEIGERILSSCPALHGADEAPSPDALISARPGLYGGNQSLP
jgi:hypothetical protein